MPECVAEHSFLGCNHQSTCMPGYSLYVQLLWYPMYYPEGMKARVSHVQWSEPHSSILAPLRIRTRAAGFRIISGDYYTTTTHYTTTWTEACDKEVRPLSTDQPTLPPTDPPASAWPTVWLGESSVTDPTHGEDLLPVQGLLRGPCLYNRPSALNLK